MNQMMTMRMMTMIKSLVSFRIIFLLTLIAWVPLSSQTIAEKKAFIYRGSDLSPELQRQLAQVNEDLQRSQETLDQLYNQVQELYLHNASESAYKELLDQIHQVTREMDAVQQAWRDQVVQSGRNEPYALWHSPETTLEQLIRDYGSQNYVYVIPADIATIPLSVDSSLPIPRAAWDEMLEMILTQNGIGIRQLNPFLRALYVLQNDRSTVSVITNNRRELAFLPMNTRAAFVLTPEPADTRRIWRFLEKFVNPNSMTLQMIGRDIFLIGQVGELQELLKLYDFAAANKGDKEYKIIPLFRVDADEIAKILGAIFEQIEENAPAVPEAEEGERTGKRSYRSTDSSTTVHEGGGLRVIPLANVARAIFLVGTKEEVRKAEEIVRQVESQVGMARERTVYWYSVKHANPEELADVLFRIYLLMQANLPQEAQQLAECGLPNPNCSGTDVVVADGAVKQDVIIQRETNPLLPQDLYPRNFYQQGAYVVNPAPVQPWPTPFPVVNQGRDNFLVDPKSGGIVMVVEAELLPRIKDVIKKLDVPTKMVQIEVLLFEIRNRRKNNFGLNLLRFGTCATNTNAGCALFNDLDASSLNSGIFAFLISRTKSSIPAYDLAYTFLMSQQDITINASPIVVTNNQMPARIAIVEEISLDTGIYNVETAKGVTLEKAFTRAQYGVNINITPTIHSRSEDGFCSPDDVDYVTLDTDITFDTPEPSLFADRPNIIRRNVTNQARIPNGQTVILGGLRRKDTTDTKQMIPFIGELPGIGKLFSHTAMDDTSTEFFVFITPKIISDPVTDFEIIKHEEMRRRPGDIPEFLCSLVAAREYENHKLMQNSMVILFGREPERCYSPSYWNDADWRCFDGP